MLFRIALAAMVLAAGSSLPAQTSTDPVLSRRDQYLLKEYGPDYPVGKDPRSGTPLEVRLKADPNDAFAIRLHAERVCEGVSKQIQIIFEQNKHRGLEKTNETMRGALPTMEATANELEAFLKACPAATPASKAAIVRANAELALLRESLLVQRTSFIEAKGRLLATPDNWLAIALFRERANLDTMFLLDIDPLEAAKLLQDIQRVFGITEQALPPERKKPSQVRASVSWQLAVLKQSVDGLEQLVTRATSALERLQARVGANAEELHADVWINNPATEQTRKGKVVLLAFLFVDIEQCVGALRELAKWDKQYQKHGLVTIGVTSYRFIRWDEESKQVVRSESGNHDEEQVAIRKIAMQNEIEFPIAIQTQQAFGKLWHAYGRFPHMPSVVLIDRRGKVKMIRMWKHARDRKRIDETLAATLTHESTTNAASRSN